MIDGNITNDSISESKSAKLQHFSITISESESAKLQHFIITC